jgi:dihydrofolate reductase
MKRKLILNLAMSLDSFIADADGGYDWIKGDGSDALDTSPAWSHEEFLESVDLVVMGRACFDQKQYEHVPNHQIWVATSKPRSPMENIQFVDGVVEAVKEELEKPGKDIYLWGGGVLIDAFLKTDLIYEYIVGIIPVILGKGRPLFLHDTPMIPLKLESYSFAEGIAILRYARK